MRENAQRRREGEMASLDSLKEEASFPKGETSAFYVQIEALGTDTPAWVPTDRIVCLPRGGPCPALVGIQKHGYGRQMSLRRR